jgi:hypothetical protein
MNRKQLLIVIVIASVLGGIGISVNKKKSASYSRGDKISSEKLLGDFPINDVAQITIRQHTNEVNLVKGETWTVKERGDYAANSETIIKFARKLWDLRAAQSQKIGESQMGRMELLPPDKGGGTSATVVELKGKDGKVIRSVYLGKKSTRGGGDEFGGGAWPNGRWVYLPDKAGTVYLVSESFDDVDSKPEMWLDKDFFKLEKVRSIAATFPEATNSWKFSRETESGEWTLNNAGPDEKPDASKTSSFSYAMSTPSFTDVLMGDAARLDKPTTFELETFDGFVYTLKVGEKVDNDHPMTLTVNAQLAPQRTPGENEKPEDKEGLDKEFADKRKALEEKLKKEKGFEKWTYLVSGYTLESLLKPRSEFMAEKNDESTATEGATIEPNPAGGISQ